MLPQLAVRRTMSSWPRNQSKCQVLPLFMGSGFYILCVLPLFWWWWQQDAWQSSEAFAWFSADCSRRNSSRLTINGIGVLSSLYVRLQVEIPIATRPLKPTEILVITWRRLNYLIWNHTLYTHSRSFPELQNLLLQGRFAGALHFWSSQQNGRAPIPPFKAAKLLSRH